MKLPGLFLSLITSAPALPVVIKSTESPVPERAALVEAISGAPDADAAADQILLHYQKHGFPAVGVEVDDLDGNREVLIDVARFQNISLSDGPSRTKAVATDHFKRLAGSYLDQNKLKSLLAGFHANPLHQVVPRLQPDAGGSSVNALLRIEQSLPHRFSAGYLDTGAHPLPRERFWIQGEFSDLWNFNSLSTARLTHSPDPADFHALQLGSRFYLSGGSEIALSLSYSGTRIDQFDAYTWQSGLQWHSKEWDWNSWTTRSAAGLSYRKSNNALEFGNLTSKGLAEVVQLSLGQNFERQWEKGLTRISASGILSLGDEGQNNSLRPGVAGNYGIFRTSIWHRQDLPKGWDLITNLGGQWSTDPVLQADQLALGGAAGLRGLPEQFALGDQGYLGGLELRTPTFNFFTDWACRPSLFLQAGETFDEVAGTSTSAVTSGVGLQIGYGASLRASIHAGWRLDEGGSEIHSQLSWKF